MPTTTQPSLASLALQADTPPDWADVVIEPIPIGDGVPTDPSVWADAIFSPLSAPPPVVALMAVRQAVVPLIGVKPAGRGVFDVTEVVGEEALIVSTDRHLDFRCGVGVDSEQGLLRVTTAVWLHGWRGRLYFTPVAVLHDPVTRSMMKRAVQRLTRSRMGE